MFSTAKYALFFRYPGHLHTKVAVSFYQNSSRNSPHRKERNWSKAARQEEERGVRDERGKSESESESTCSPRTVGQVKELTRELLVSSRILFKWIFLLPQTSYKHPLFLPTRSSFTCSGGEIYSYKSRHPQFVHSLAHFRYNFSLSLSLSRVDFIQG